MSELEPSFNPSARSRGIVGVGSFGVVRKVKSGTRGAFVLCRVGLEGFQCGLVVSTCKDRVSGSKLDVAF